MQLEVPTPSVFRLEPPPLWYVTNGDLTVGPVVTGLLTKGVEFGRIPDFCHVRTYRGGWRTLESVREISALHSKVKGIAQAPNPDQLAEWSEPRKRLRDEMELCHQVAFRAVMVTGAECAMVHFRGSYSRSLITRSVVGPISNERLGYALPETDLLLRSARQGIPVFGPPYGPTEDALALRFAASRGGAGAVAMIPVFHGGQLTAMLELSRPGHAFRRSDLRRAERIVQHALFQRSN